MPDVSYYREQAARFDRVADQCTISALVPYYRKLAEDCRERAADESMSSPDQDYPLGRCAAE
jgi:hypothetical protein